MYNGTAIMMNKAMEELEMIRFDKLSIFYHTCAHASLHHNF